MTNLTLPAGTVVQINGIPMELATEAVVSTHEGNVPLILEKNETAAGSGGTAKAL